MEVILETQFGNLPPGIIFLCYNLLIGTDICNKGEEMKWQPFKDSFLPVNTSFFVLGFSYFFPIGLRTSGIQRKTGNAFKISFSSMIVPLIYLDMSHIITKKEMFCCKMCYTKKLPMVDIFSDKPVVFF